MEQKWYWWTAAALIVGLLLVGSVFQLFSATDLQQHALSSGSYDSSRQAPAEHDFAPDVSERLVTRSASMTTEVERGAVREAMSSVQGIAQRTEAIILQEDYTQSQSRAVAQYTIKVPAERYEEAVDLLKDVGELQRLDEDADDITGRVKDLEVELRAERERLERLKQLSADRSSLSDQLTLEDHIFDQERRILYLEEELEQSDVRVRYSTIQMTVREEESALAALDFVRFEQLVATFIGSFKVLLYFLSAILPWVLTVSVFVLLYYAGRKLRKN